MPIKSTLFENNITSDPDDYAAMVQISGSADGDEIRAAHVSKRLDLRWTL